MSLQNFQSAIADLISSPALCVAARASPDEVLGRYDLTPREKRRLADIVWQKGMSTNCSLYRSNRVTPIYTMLHHSCLLLGESLLPELDAYWASSEFIDMQYGLEIARFARFLKRRMADGSLCCPWLDEVLDFELAVNALQFLPRRKILADLARAECGAGRVAPRLSPLVRVVRFLCDPEALLRALAEQALDRRSIPEGENFLLLSALRAPMETVRLDARTGRILSQLQSGLAFTGNSEELERLARAGVVVHHPFWRKRAGQA